MFRDILIALDLNDLGQTEDAVAYVKDYAAGHDGATIHVIAVVPDFQMSIVGSFFPPDYEKKVLAEARKALHEATDKAFGEAGVKCIVAHGNVYKEILHAAKEIKADLIVMGSGASTASDFLLGTNAARVARHAKTSVLVLR